MTRDTHRYIAVVTRFAPGQSANAVGSLAGDVKGGRAATNQTFDGRRRAEATLRATMAQTAFGDIGYDITGPEVQADCEVAPDSSPTECR